MDCEQVCRHHVLGRWEFTALNQYVVVYHLYADYTQFCASLDKGNKADVSISLEHLERSIADIQL